MVSFVRTVVASLIKVWSFVSEAVEVSLLSGCSRTCFSEPKIQDTRETVSCSLEVFGVAFYP